jgi:hypothetical protein
MRSILGPGDVYGDTWADIMARDTSGRLWVYRDKGTSTQDKGVNLGEIARADRPQRRGGDESCDVRFRFHCANCRR